MRLSGQSGKTIQRCGAAWIVLAPIRWFMMAISTEKSETVQVAAFSTVAAIGLVCGVVALWRYSWAGWGLFGASLTTALYFLGLAAYAVIFPFVPWTTLKQPGVASLPLMA